MQTDASSYGFSVAPAQAGQKYDLGPDRVDSKSAEGEVAFGAPVVRGTDPDKQCKIAESDTEKFLGVALFTQFKSQDVNGIAFYRDTETVNVMRKGRVWVRVTEAVAGGDTAYVDLNDTTLGFCKTSGGGNLATGGKFERGAAANGLAVLELS